MFICSSSCCQLILFIIIIAIKFNYFVIKHVIYEIVFNLGLSIEEVIVPTFIVFMMVQK